LAALLEANSAEVGSCSVNCSAVWPGHAGPLAGPLWMWQKRLERADPQTAVQLVMEQKERGLEVV